MKRYVRLTVSKKAKREGNLNTAENQLPAFGEAVYVISHSNPHSGITSLQDTSCSFQVGRFSQLDIVRIASDHFYRNAVMLQNAGVVRTVNAFFCCPQGRRNNRFRCKPLGRLNFEETGPFRGAFHKGLFVA